MTQLAPHHAAARRLDLPSGRVATLDATPAGPPVATILMLPGFTGSKEDFAPLLDPLAADGYRVAAVDLPGQYQSPGPDDQDAYAVDRLAAVVNALAGTLPGPVHLLGHSFGGLVARAAVLADPARYRSLVLLCSGPAGIDGGRRERMARLEPYAAQGMAALQAAMEQEAAADPGYSAVPQELRDFLRTRLLESSLPGLFGMGEALLTEPDRVTKLREAGVPVLVAFGAADDAWDPAVQVDMATRLGAPVAVIDHAAHSPAIENTTGTLAALRPFWAAH